MKEKFAWHRDWIAWYLGLTLLIRLVDVATLAKDVGQPFGGYLTYYNVIADRVSLSRETPPWWPGLAPGRLNLDDRLLAIDGMPYDLYHEKLAYAQAVAAGRQQVLLLVERPLDDKGAYDPHAPRRELPVPIPVTRFTWQQCFDLAFPVFLVAASLWILAVTVYIAHPTTALNRFTSVAFASAILLSQNRHTLFWFGDWPGRLIDAVSLIAFALVSALLFHAALRFPTPLLSKTKFRWIAIPVYGLAGGLTVAYLISRSLLWSREPITLAIHPETVQYIVRYLDARAFYGMYHFQTAAFAAFFLRLGVESLRPRVGRRQRRESFVLLIGLFVTWISLLVHSLSPLRLGTTINFWQRLDLRYGLLALPLAATYVILRYQTLRRPPPALLLVLMLTFSGLVGSAGVALLCALTPDSCPTTTAPLFLLVFGVALASALGWTLGTSWRGWFGRLLHRQRSNYAAVRAFGQRLLQGEERTMETLPPALAASLCRELELEQAAVWLWDVDREEYRLAGASGDWPTPLPERLAPKTEDLTTRSLPLHLARFPAPTWLRDLPRPCQVAVLLGLGEEPVGLLGLGTRWDERVLSEEDLEVFDLIGQQATLLLVTTRQIAEIRQTPMLIVEAQERERARLAREIHDTTQQFLGRLPWALQRSYDLIESDPGSARKILLECSADSAKEATVLRHTLHDLSPVHLESDFSRSIEQLIHRFQVQSGISAHLEMTPDLGEIDLGIRHIVYRVFQQALDNISLHAQARQVEISLFRRDGYLNFYVRDDGVGYVAAKTRSGFGLRSMQARVQSVGGVISWHSRPGRGTKVEGTIPLRPWRGDSSSEPIGGRLPKVSGDGFHAAGPAGG